MSENDVNYQREFFRSQWNLWLAVGTIGLSLAFANLFAPILGIVGYVIGLLNIPSLPIFRKHIDAEKEAQRKLQEEQQIMEFKLKRDKQLYSLSYERQCRYGEMAKICQSIEGHSSSNSIQVRKLDEIMWAYLKLLSAEQGVENMLASEDVTEVDEVISDLTIEIGKDEKNLEEKRATLSVEVFLAKERLISSKKDRLAAMTSRRDKLSLAKSNLELISTELNRLEEQIKLARANALSETGTDSISSQIDATISGFDQMSALLKDFGRSEDILGSGIPNVSSRIGFGGSSVEMHIGGLPNYSSPMQNMVEPTFKPSPSRAKKTTIRMASR